MTVPADPSLCLVLVALFAGQLAFNVKHPNASKTTQLAVLTVVAVVFFLVCGLMLGQNAAN
ncbi:hypothetical protein [uncultured Paludibaculum sp.]|uniref:hypothetical protein n=1 Tax=uncultured Paludibaculum sp. TaxID=1765020 RepID=UPI002AAC4A68|nr:hypothetical protein [uncultured Paludibaculum sp.]